MAIGEFVTPTATIAYAQLLEQVLEVNIFQDVFLVTIIQVRHCVKSVRIRRYSGPHFLAFGLKEDQNNFDYGHFLRSGGLHVQK